MKLASLRSVPNSETKQCLVYKLVDLRKRQGHGVKLNPWEHVAFITYRFPFSTDSWLFKLSSLTSTSEGGRELSGKLKPASTHALSVSLAPAGTRHRSHISRTISHPWLPNPDKLFFKKWLITKIQFNFHKNIPERPLMLTLCSNCLQTR